MYSRCSNTKCFHLSSFKFMKFLRTGSFILIPYYLSFVSCENSFFLGHKSLWLMRLPADIKVMNGKQKMRNVGSLLRRVKEQNSQTSAGVYAPWVIIWVRSDSSDPQGVIMRRLGWDGWLYEWHANDVQPKPKQIPKLWIELPTTFFLSFCEKCHFHSRQLNAPKNYFILIWSFWNIFNSCFHLGKM